MLLVIAVCAGALLLLVLVGLLLGPAPEEQRDAAPDRERTRRANARRRALSYTRRGRAMNAVQSAHVAELSHDATVKTRRPAG